MKNKQLIIFDMDGTLIDSGNVISNTVNYVRTTLGLSVMPKQELLSSINNPDIISSEFFYGTKAFTDEQTKLFGDYYHENCIKDIALYEGIEVMLHEINKHFTLSIATNASVEFAQKMIEHLNINKHFNFVIGANQVSLPKPHPEMLINTTNKLSIDIKNSILIGDSEKDKHAALSCDMDYLLVNWGFTQHDHKCVVSNVEELHKKLLALL
jgi:phosphoglycolate phosphatase